MLIVIYYLRLKDTTTGTMAVPRPTMKGQKVGQFLENPHLSPEIDGIILSLVNL